MDANAARMKADTYRMNNMGALEYAQTYMKSILDLIDKHASKGEYRAYTPDRHILTAKELNVLRELKYRAENWHKTNTCGEKIRFAIICWDLNNNEK